jgi:uncharacterized protein (DUF2236 family)
MLRASIEYQGGEGDLRAVTEGAKAADSGVAHGEALTAFAEAAVRGDPAELATARDTLRDVAGSAVLVDAAGVVGNFQRMVRIADGAGISLDTSVGILAEDFREELGLDQFESAGRSKRLSTLTRTLSPLLRGAARIGLRAIGRRARRRAGV